MKKLVALLVVVFLTGALFSVGFSVSAASPKEDPANNASQKIYEKLAMYYLAQINRNLSANNIPDEKIVENYVRYKLYSNGSLANDEQVREYASLLISSFEEVIQKRNLDKKYTLNSQSQAIHQS